MLFLDEVLFAIVEVGDGGRRTARPAKCSVDADLPFEGAGPRTAEASAKLGILLRNRAPFVVEHKCGAT